MGDLSWFNSMIHKIFGHDPEREHRIRAAMAYDELEFSANHDPVWHHRDAKTRKMKRLRKKSRLRNNHGFFILDDVGCYLLLAFLCLCLFSFVAYLWGNGSGSSSFIQYTIPPGYDKPIYSVTE